MLQFNKKLATLALLAVASVSGSILSVSTVSAQQATKADGVKDVTLFSSTTRRSSEPSFASNKKVADLSKVGFDNKASFVQVNNGKAWRFYEGKNFKGKFVEVGPNEGRPLTKLNKQISSFRSVK
jgi:hypothetical protein